MFLVLVVSEVSWCGGSYYVGIVIHIDIKVIIFAVDVAERALAFEQEHREGGRRTWGSYLSL